MADNSVVLSNPVCMKDILGKIESSFSAADGNVNFFEVKSYNLGHTVKNELVTTANVTVNWKNATYYFTFELKNVENKNQLKGTGKCEVVEYKLSASGLN